MRSAERTTWQNPKVLTTLLLVFVAGALSGAAVMRYGLHQTIHKPAAGALSNPKSAEQFLTRCQKELNLTPQQTTQLQDILDDYKKYYETLQVSLDDVRATGKSRIMSVLDDRQRARFEKLLVEMK